MSETVPLNGPACCSPALCLWQPSRVRAREAGAALRPSSAARPPTEQRPSAGTQTRWRSISLTIIYVGKRDVAACREPAVGFTSGGSQSSRPAVVGLHLAPSYTCSPSVINLCDLCRKLVGLFFSRFFGVSVSPPSSFGFWRTAPGFRGFHRAESRRDKGAKRAVRWRLRRSDSRFATLMD